MPLSLPVTAWGSGCSRRRSRRVSCCRTARFPCSWCARTGHWCARTWRHWRRAARRRWQPWVSERRRTAPQPPAGVLVVLPQVQQQRAVVVGLPRVLGPCPLTLSRHCHRHHRHQELASTAVAAARVARHRTRTSSKACQCPGGASRTSAAGWTASPICRSTSTASGRRASMVSARVR